MKQKKDRMSGQERLDSLFHYRKPDRVPIAMSALGFSGKNMGLSIRDTYADPERCFVALLWTEDQYGWDSMPMHFRHVVLGAHDFGGNVQLPEGEYEGMNIVSHPVGSEDDVENLKLPDPKRAGGIEVATKFARLQESHGIPITFLSRSPFTMAGNICGLEQFCRWTIRKPELCNRLLDLAIAHILNVLRDWSNTFGAENLFIWLSAPSESNQVISPKIFEKFALPYHLKFHEEAKALGIKRFAYHICGDQNLNLPLIAQAASWRHPSILSFGHEVNLETAMKLFPRDVIYGNIEPALIQTETAQVVYDLAKGVIEKGKKAPGGFILSAGCQLPNGSPPGNVFAITKAVDDFGWYE